MTDESIRVPPATLSGFVARVLTAFGLPQTDAAKVAFLMVEADLHGSDTHGVFRLRQYFDRLKGGGINPRPNIHIERQAKAMAVVNGDNGFGHLVMDYATELAMDKAAETGFGWVGVNHSNHAGPGFLYAKMPLARDMIGLYTAVSSAKHVPPWGGTEKMLGTNPIAVAIPALDEPTVSLDMATTVAAMGKVKVYAQRDQTMPVDWMIGPDGKPLTDAKRHNEGYLLPIGGPKGYGLALIIGLLAGTLNGAALGREVVDFSTDLTTVSNTGQFIAALDIRAFGDVGHFRQQVDEVVRALRASPTLPGYDRVQVPGDGSHAKYLDRRAAGIPLHANLLMVLDEIAAEAAVDRLQR